MPQPMAPAPKAAPQAGTGKDLKDKEDALKTANDAVTAKEKEIETLKKAAEEAKAAVPADPNAADYNAKKTAYDTAAGKVTTAEGALPALKTAVETAKKAHDKAEATRRSLVRCSSDILRLKRKIRR